MEESEEATDEEEAEESEDTVDEEAEDTTDEETEDTEDEEETVEEDEESAEAETEQPEEDLSLTYPEKEFIEETEYVHVYVKAGVGAFPAGTTMEIEDVDIDDDTFAAIEEAVEQNVSKVRAVNITFFDVDGNEIEPAIPVQVIIKAEESTKDEEIKVVHVDDDGVAKEVETVKPEALEERDGEAQATIIEPGTGEETQETSSSELDDTVDTEDQEADQTENTDDQTAGLETGSEDSNDGAVITPENQAADETENTDTTDSASETVTENLSIRMTRTLRSSSINSAPANNSAGTEIQVDSSAASESIFSGSDDSTELVSFYAGGFSIYALVYTVDFSYSVNGKMYEFSLPGGGFVSFAKLVEILGIIDDKYNGQNSNETGTEITEDGVNEGIEESDSEKNTLVEADENATPLTLNDVVVSNATKEFVTDVVSVEFSSPELVDVSKVEEETTVGQIKKSRGLEVKYSTELTEEQIEEINAQTVEAGDWALISVQPFTSEEMLTVTMKDGVVFTIRVTDAQIKKTVIDAKGNAWEITVTYGPEAEIPDDARLEVEEILPEDESYQDYYQKSLETIGVITPEKKEETGDVRELQDSSETDAIADDVESFDDSIETGNTEKETKEKAKKTVSDYARIFNIEIWADNVKVEPAADVTVNIKLLDAPEKTEATPQVVHFAKDGTELMELRKQAENSEDEGIQFITNEFSIYSVVYTVDFGFNINGKQYDFSIEGGNAITFREAIELFEIIEIEDVDEFINDVVKVEFSNPEYLWIGKVEEDTRIGELKEKNELEVEYSSELKQGNIDAINIRPIKAPDWVLVSLKPFESDETLTVTMENGDVFTINVTDAQDDAVLNPNGTVQTISNPAGTTMDLFDYWITDAYRYTAGRDAWPGHYRYPSGPMYSEFYEFDWYDYYGNYQCSWGDGFNNWTGHDENWRNSHLRGNGNTQGINAGHNFKFNPGVGGTVKDGTQNKPAADGSYGVNSWTENASPRPGLVLGTLVGGYPKLTTDTSLGTDGSSLDYLFNSNNGTGKQAYTGVNHLLYVDKDGYYTFNSDDFDAQFDASSKTFTVRPQSNPTGEARGFWPFGNQVYWHGMHINTQFSMPVEGKVLSPNGNYNDMVFEFQGDDDTWVYIDNVLVGDGGGVHNQTRIVVNFRDGTVLVSGEYDVRDNYKTDYHVVKYLDDLYRDAGVYDQYEWMDSPTVPGHKTFAPKTYHTFDMFYLERGGGESNLYIHYNMIATYDFTAHKSYHNGTSDRMSRDEFKFELLGLDGQYKNGVCVNADKTAIMPRGGSESGTGNVGDAQKVHYGANGEKPGYTYYKVGVTEDGNVNFGQADFSSQEMHDCDEGNPSTYRYIIREVVPDDAVNEFGVKWKDATEEEKVEGGFIFNGITYDDKIYYMTATVTRWQQDGRWMYGLTKKYYTDDTYTTETSDTFANFVNGFVQPLTLEVLKTSDKGGKLLEGAEFSLTRAMHTEDQKWVPRHYIKDNEVIYAPTRTGTTSSQGTLTFDNLTEGHYILEETAAPQGYETDETTKWLVTLTKQDSDDVIKLIPTFTPLNEDGSIAGAVSDPVEVDRNHTFQYQVLNGKPPIDLSLEKQWFDNGDSIPPADASATFELHRVKNISPVRVELLDSHGERINYVNAFVGDTIKIYDSGENDFQHHTPIPNWMAVGDKTRSDIITPSDSGWTINTINHYEVTNPWPTIVLSSYTSTSNGQYTVKEADVDGGVIQLKLSDNYIASQTYGFDKLPKLYVSNSVGGSGSVDEVYDDPSTPQTDGLFTLPTQGDGGSSWIKTFTDLPKMDEQGNEYSYYFVEVAHYPENYSCTSTSYGPFTENTDVVVTNRTPDLPKITASKVWKDDLGNVIDAESGLDDLEVQLTLYKGTDPAPASEIRDEAVTQTVTGNGMATWFLLDEHGDVTQYSVRETKVKIPGGDFVDVTTENLFERTITGDSTDGYTVTNQLPETEIEVTKQWKDGTSENADRVFEETKTINFTLYQKLDGNDGTVYMRENQPITGTVTYMPADGETQASWSTESITNLPKYVYSDGSWNEAVYYPVESEINGVTITYQSPEGNTSVTASDVAVSSGTVTIINTDIVVPLKIVKVDKNTEIGLSGAKFQLTRKLSGEGGFTKFIHSDFEEDPENENQKTGPFIVDSTDGIILEGLLPGEYTIEEKKAPDGYNISLQPFTFTVNANGSISSTDADDSLVLHLDKDEANPEGFQIGNTPGSALPSTGGPGTKLIYFLGCFLSVGAGIILLLQKRRRKV